MRKAKTLVAMVAILLTVTFVQMAIAEVPVFDTQSLIGEWWGEWNTINGQFSGKIYITVEKIDGSKVFGVAEATGADKYLRHEKFVGVLEGNVLSITLSRLWLSLTIEDKTMEGSARGGQESNLKLNKRK